VNIEMKSNNQTQQQEQGSDLQEKLVRIMRTAKVVKGGRQFRFTALVVLGDGQGRVGYGLGKAKEVPQAIAKAVETAKKSMVQFPLHGTTLQHPIVARHGATKVFMRPASPGTGIIAGGAMRAIFEVMGIKDVLAKIIGSTNATNVVIATMKGLETMVTPSDVAKRRGVKKILSSSSSAGATHAEK